MDKKINQTTQAFAPMLTWVCRTLIVLLVIVMFANVFLRFGFNAGSIKLQDLQSYLFAVFVLLAIVYATIGNKHVRAGFGMDETDRKSVSKTVALLEVVLGIFSFTLIFFYSISGVISSWIIFEGSTEPDGLGGYFLVRTMLPVVCVLIVLFLLRRVWLIMQDTL